MGWRRRNRSRFCSQLGKNVPFRVREFGGEELDRLGSGMGANSRLIQGTGSDVRRLRARRSIWLIAVAVSVIN